MNLHEGSHQWGHCASRTAVIQRASRVCDMETTKSMHFMRMLRLHRFPNANAVVAADPARRLLADSDIARIASSYRFSMAKFDTNESSLWNAVIFPQHKSFHETVLP